MVNLLLDNTLLQGPSNQHLPQHFTPRHCAYGGAVCTNTNRLCTLQIVAACVTLGGHAVYTYVACHF